MRAYSNQSEARRHYVSLCLFFMKIYVKFKNEHTASWPIYSLYMCIGSGIRKRIILRTAYTTSRYPCKTYIAASF